MRALYLRYNRKKFWEDYWKEFGVDMEEFIDLNMYPIEMTLKYVKKTDKILECGFGGGRVIRHLSKYGYDVEGIEYDSKIVEELKKVDNSLKIYQGDILNLAFEDNRFDATLCFGVIGGLYDKMARAIQELQRVTKNNGIIIISVMLDNIARTIQKILNSLFNKNQKKEFYAWMDTEEGWNNYFKSFGLQIIDSKEIISRYNIYYWAKFLRSSQKSNLKLARVKEDAYKLNPIGEIFWLIHKYVLKKQLAAGITFVFKNIKNY